MIGGSKMFEHHKKESPIISLAGVGGGAASYIFYSASGNEVKEISRSLRFDKNSQSYMNWTPSSPGTLTTWTLSGWVKRTEFGSYTPILVSADTSSTTEVAFATDNTIQVADGSTTYRKTNAAFRDPSAWYHIVVIWDTTNSTVAHRCRVFVNGVEQTYSTEATISENQGTDINTTDIHYVGRQSNTYTSCYQADIHFIDGQAKEATEFASYDEYNNWNPKSYSGSYGSNGFNLTFSNITSTATLGYDTSGNNNNFTVNNFSLDDGNAVTVANATGALPIRNTSGDQGGSVTSGNRSDSNSSYLEIAAPLNDATDQSGNNRTISNSGVTFSASESRFYGVSAYFDGNDEITINQSGNIFDFGTGDFTIEIWARPSSTSGDQYIISWECPGPNAGHAGFNIYQGNWRLGAFNNDLTGGSTGLAANTWVHLAMARQGTTLRTFINGALQDEHSNSDNMSSTTALTLGKYAGGASLRFTGYMQDLRVYKGVAKYTSSFNPPRSAAHEIGAGYDSVLDSPTNVAAESGNNIGNYCTWNPLTHTRGTVTEGNQIFYGNGTNTPRITGTISASSGKWYYESTVLNDGPGTGSGDVHNSIGWGLDTVGPLESAPNNSSMQHSFYFMDSGWYKNFSGSNTNTSNGKWLKGDVIGVAADLDNNTLVFYRNGSQVLSQTIGTTAGTRLCPAHQSNTGNYGRLFTNWGQQPFKYTPPSNHLSFCTENLPTPDISDGSDYFDTVLYQGDSSASRSVSGYSFSPDFLWVKERTQTAADWSHRLADSVRGAGVSVSSNSTDAQRDASAQAGGGIETFTSDGFTIQQGTSNNNNQNNNNSDYVAWAWDAADSTSTLNTGNTQSEVRVNSTSKFSIVKWTNPSGSTTVGHGLGVKPEVIFTKGLGSCEWQVYHESVGNNYKLYLDDDNGRISSSVWGTTDPTATVFTFDDNRTQDFIAYCFKSVDGYSSFGSYNAVTANSVYPFVYTGFRPAWVMHKRYDTGGTNVGDWRIWDSKRNTYNAATTLLFPNKNTQDATNAAHGLDILSNGFKIRTSDSNINPSSGNFVYFAFAENPFRTARAR